MKARTPTVVYIVVDREGMPWGDACLNRQLAEMERDKQNHTGNGHVGRLRIREYRLVPRGHQ